MNHFNIMVYKTATCFGLSLVHHQGEQSYESNRQTILPSPVHGNVVTKAIARPYCHLQYTVMW